MICCMHFDKSVAFSERVAVRQEHIKLYSSLASPSTPCGLLDLAGAHTPDLNRS